MKLFRYKPNGLLYTITTGRPGQMYKVFPYKHKTEIGILFKKNNRYRDFKGNMYMKDFEIVSEI